MRSQRRESGSRSPSPRGGRRSRAGPSSAQWRSSRTMTSGLRSASPSKNRRHAAKLSMRRSPDAPASAPSESPSSGWSSRVTHAASEASGTTSSTAERSLASARSPGSPSRMPACDFRISPSAQNATPSPYGRQRPCRQKVSSGRSSTATKSSWTSRLLPMPGTPTSVISCGELSCSTRASVEIRSASSRSRPTSGVLGRRVMSVPNRERAWTASQTCTGSVLPFASTGGASRYSITRAVAL